MTARRTGLPGGRVAAAAVALLAATAYLPAAARLLARPTRAPIVLPRPGDLAEGDLIFRSGVSRDSAMVRFADPGAGYSHVGLVDLDGGITYVVHIEPGVTADESRIRREPLAVFLAADRADGVAVFHLRAADRGRGPAAVAAALRYRDRGVSFDQGADLATGDQQYCTELVCRSYRTAGLDLLDGDFGPTVPLIDRPAVRLTALLHSRHLVAGPIVR
jgi:hypothetical protein